MAKNKYSYILAAILALELIVFTGFSYFSAAGDWRNQVLGIGITTENDPGGPYLLSSIDLMEGDTAPFVAGSHPGITLQYYLHVLLKSGYYLFNSDDSLSFQAYAAHNIESIFFWAKLGISILQILSFVLLLYFTSLFFSKETAALATIFYATSFAPMYYFSKISPEPVIVIIFLAILIILYKIHDRTIPANSLQGALAVLALSFLSVAAIITKLQILAITPVAVLCYLIYANWKNACSKRISYISVAYMPLLFLLASIALFFPFSAKVDWPEYFIFWRGVMQGNYHAYGAPRETFSLYNFLFNNCVGIFLDYLYHIKVFLTTNLIYHFRTNNVTSLFMLTEWSVLVTAAYGGFHYFTRNRDRLSFWIFPGCFLIFNLATYIVKPRFNYLFLFQVIFSVFAAYGLGVLFDRYLIKTKYSRILAIATAILVMHYTAVYSVINSRFDDVKTYRSRCRPYYEATNKLKHDQRLGIVFTGSKPVETLPLKLSWDFIDQESPIMREISSTYVQLSRDKLLSMENKAELTDYLDKNRISLIIETSASGQPLRESIPANKWVENQF